MNLVLDGGVGGGWSSAGGGIKLSNVLPKKDEEQDLFSMGELDQKPRPTYQPSPVMSAKVRKQAPGTVHVVFIVDEKGRVKNPKIQKSTNPVFERPALNAVKKWRFEPGTRGGKPVQFPMRVPITFPKG